MPTLKQVLPKQFAEGRYADAPAYAMRDVKVIARKLATGAPCSSHGAGALFETWPGPHKHVRYWFVLENRKAVGFDEDPEKGWSFPIIDYEP